MFGLTCAMNTAGCKCVIGVVGCLEEKGTLLSGVVIDGTEGCFWQGEPLLILLKL